jgi:hypothetical protein
VYSLAGIKHRANATEINQNKGCTAAKYDSGRLTREKEAHQGKDKNNASGVTLAFYSYST